MKNWDGLQANDEVDDVYKPDKKCKCFHGREECCIRQYEQTLREHTSKEQEMLEAQFPRVKHEAHPKLDKYVIHPVDGKAIFYTHEPVLATPNHIAVPITHESQLTPR